MKNNDKSDFKPIYIHWYEDDFQADLLVKRMSSRQRAFYRNLLMYCYFGRERPYLTTDDDELWLIADADSKDEWVAEKKPILAKFTLTVTKDGQRLLTNKRVLEEWRIIEGWLVQKQKAGLASAAARRRENGHSSGLDPVLIVHPATFNDRSTPVEQPVDSLLTGSQEPPKSFSTYEDVDENEDVDGNEHQQFGRGV